MKTKKEMVSVKNILTTKNPAFFKKYPKFFTDFSTAALGKLLREREINGFLAERGFIPIRFSISRTRW